MLPELTKNFFRFFISQSLMIWCKYLCFRIFSYERWCERCNREKLFTKNGNIIRTNSAA